MGQSTSASLPHSQPEPHRAKITHPFPQCNQIPFPGYSNATPAIPSGQLFFSVHDDRLIGHHRE